jgi:hypothetical protein
VVSAAINPKGKEKKKKSKKKKENPLPPPPPQGLDSDLHSPFMQY